MVVSIVGLGVEDKDTVVHFNQSMKAVCIENNSVSKKDKSFLVGEEARPLIFLPLILSLFIFSLQLLSLPLFLASSLLLT